MPSSAATQVDPSHHPSVILAIPDVITGSFAQMPSDNVVVVGGSVVVVVEEFVVVVGGRVLVVLVVLAELVPAGDVGVVPSCSAGEHPTTRRTEKTVRARRVMAP